METPDNLVYIDEHGLLGSNFYWEKYAVHGLTKDDVIAAGVTNGKAQISSELIEPLKAVEKMLEEKGWRLYIKEGYRPKALYEILYTRRVAKYGKEVTDSILNMEKMPHALGFSVDATLWDTATNQEVFMRRKKDGIPALFINFYKDKIDPESQRLQQLQDFLAELMTKHGFRIGTKREYFHFDYRPGTEPNYYV